MKREYDGVLNKRELQYNMDVESDPSKKDLRQALNIHNDIVLGTSVALSDISDIKI